MYAHSAGCCTASDSGHGSHACCESTGTRQPGQLECYSQERPTSSGWHSEGQCRTTSAVTMCFDRGEKLQRVVNFSLGFKLKLLASGSFQRSTQGARKRKKKVLRELLLWSPVRSTGYCALLWIRHAWQWNGPRSGASSPVVINKRLHLVGYTSRSSVTSENSSAVRALTFVPACRHVEGWVPDPKILKHAIQGEMPAADRNSTTDDGADLLDRYANRGRKKCREIRVSRSVNGDPRFELR